MNKYYIKERPAFDEYGNIIRGAVAWRSVRDNGKILYFDSIQDAQFYKEKPSNRNEYKLMVKDK